MELDIYIQSTCTKCDNCRLICPENAILSNGFEYKIDTFSCTFCSLCVAVCPEDCIKLSEKTSTN